MRNKIVGLFVILTAIVFWPKVSLAAEQIKNLGVQITVNKDSSIRVEESITYDFGTESRHGIYRDILYKYQARGGNFNLRLSDVSVTDETGKKLTFSVSNNGDYKRIKIGDADLYVSGQKVYVIGYTVKRALNYFDDYDELYWNATGNEWAVPILKSSAEVTLPAGVPSSSIQTKCFAGSYGSSDNCQTNNASGNKAEFSQSLLDPGEGLTFVVGFPKGLVTQPTLAQNVLDTVKDNWFLALPFVTLIFFIWLWRTRGRDPGPDTVVAQYESPDSLSPTALGTIVDEKVDGQDVSAEIIQLAVEGYIKITRLEKKVLLFTSTDYQIDLIKQPAGFKEAYKNTLFNGLFKDNRSSVKLSDLKEKFYKDLAEVKKQTYEQVVKDGYFLKNPQTTRGLYLALGFGLVALGVGLGIMTRQFFMALSFGLSGLVAMIFSPFMPVKTLKGAETKSKILGLKLYLSVAEKDRLKFHNAPAKKPEIFEKLLPFAIALGVENQWAKQFESIYLRPPSWYNDGHAGNFNSLLFVSSLHNFSSSANTAMASTPGAKGGAAGGHSGFGGGGFSGGGFGGGGGGSW